MTRPDTDETPIYTALTKETAAKEALEALDAPK